MKTVTPALIARYAREVVAQRLAVLAVLTGLLHAAVALHWISATWSDTAVAQTTAAIDLLGLIMSGVVIRRVVTPVKDPRANTGEPLMPVADHIAMLASLAQFLPALPAAPDVAAAPAAAPAPPIQAQAVAPPPLVTGVAAPPQTSFTQPFPQPAPPQ